MHDIWKTDENENKQKINPNRDAGYMIKMKNNFI